MITVMLQGRLGNQMFQYAFLRNLQNAYYPNDDIFVNPQYITRQESSETNGWQDDLKRFNVIDYKYTNKMNISIIQKIVFYLYKGVRRLYYKFSKHHKDAKKFELHFTPLLNYFGLYCLNTGYYKFKKSRFKNKLISGSFECDCYFNDVKDILIAELTPKNRTMTHTQTINDMQKGESICVTIRRGDFLDSKYKEQFYICDENYFCKAIQLMNEKIDNPHYYVFSDDIEWVQNNMQFPEGTYYESGEDNLEDKILLMSSCHHFIISNSTFSWWAQYLSSNIDKIVIAPSIWSREITNRDIFQKNWTLINVEHTKKEQGYE